VDASLSSRYAFGVDDIYMDASLIPRNLDVSVVRIRSIERPWWFLIVDALLSSWHEFRIGDTHMDALLSSWYLDILVVYIRSVW